MAAKCVSTNAGLWELFGLRTVLRAEGPSPSGSAPSQRALPGLPGLGVPGSGTGTLSYRVARHVGSGPRCRASSSLLLLLGFLNDCPRRSCVPLHTVVYRPQCRLPPPCKRTHAEITAGADAGDWAQNKPGNAICAAAGVGKEMSCNPRHRFIPSRAWWFPSSFLQKL